MKLLFAFLVNLIIMPQIDGKTVLDLELDAVALIEEGIKSEIGVSWREARIGLEIIELNTPSFYFDADATEGLSVKLQGVGLSYFNLPANLPGFYFGLGFRRNKMLVNDTFSNNNNNEEKLWNWHILAKVGYRIQFRYFNITPGVEILRNFPVKQTIKISGSQFEVEPSSIQPKISCGFVF